ncbi:hypothetical protein BXZ70DRAFT_644907 [Cristinia sonorae]|uniref:Uncharacterized protein n=1 Tax=Cristinia sonorae TaxID=1940300 RepID=A0A8K0XKE3_9AGAR|nr:hypothetical protein BXZ70DRAFT_644907 [Cristinia sonorae]
MKASFATERREPTIVHMANMLRPPIMDVCFSGAVFDVLRTSQAHPSPSRGWHPPYESRGRKGVDGGRGGHEQSFYRRNWSLFAINPCLRQVHVGDGARAILRLRTSAKREMTRCQAERLPPLERRNAVSGRLTAHRFSLRYTESAGRGYSHSSAGSPNSPQFHSPHRTLFALHQTRNTANFSKTALRLERLSGQASIRTISVR